MNLSDLTTALVLRGFQKKDPGGPGTYVPPAGGRYWLILPATVSLDGNNWLCVYPDGNDMQISVCAAPGGTVEECSLHISSSPVVVRFSSIPASLDGLLDGYNQVAAICNQAGDALLSDALLAQRLSNNLPDWLQVDVEAEVD